MARKRLNDTAALTARPAQGPLAENERVSVSVRRIDNGYIVDTSRDLDGEYSCKQEFTPEKPDLRNVMRSDEPAQGTNSLRSATRYLKP